MSHARGPGRGGGGRPDCRNHDPCRLCPGRELTRGGLLRQVRASWRDTDKRRTCYRGLSALIFFSSVDANPRHQEPGIPKGYLKGVRCIPFCTSILLSLASEGLKSDPLYFLAIFYAIGDASAVAYEYTFIYFLLNFNLMYL